jgi:hypothetical protein
VEAGPGGLIDDDLAYVAPWGFDPARVVAPILLLHGGKDRVVPSSHGEWLAHRCPSAQLWLSPHEGHISVLHRSVHGVAPGTRRRGLSPPGRLGQVLQEAAILTLRAGVRGREILRTSFGRRMRGELTWCPLRVATREERLEAPLSAENTTDPSATGTIVPSLVSGPACVGG